MVDAKPLLTRLPSGVVRGIKSRLTAGKYYRSYSTAT